MLSWEDTYQLSRFVLIRTGPSGLVLESSLNNRHFPVRGASVIRIIEALSRPVTLESLLCSVKEPEQEVLRSFLNTCYEAQLLTRVREDGVTEEDAGPLGYWEFHDMLFHTSTRFGRNRRPIGGTCRLKDRLPPEQPLADDDGENGERIALPQPGSGPHMQYRDVLEKRRSAYGQEPLTLETLGMFLYWTCRVTNLKQIGDEIFVQKLYPSGGSLHPLRVSVATESCEGCAPGLYRYLDRSHSLLRVPASEAAVQEFLDGARSSTGGLAHKPGTLIIISARFHRTAWKYESIAYRLVLLETGTLLQTMYLTAAALGLKGCAIGCGDSDHFARIVQTDYYTESSVGEFLLSA